MPPSARKLKWDQEKNLIKVAKGGKNAAFDFFLEKCNEYLSIARSDERKRWRERRRESKTDRHGEKKGNADG